MNRNAELIGTAKRESLKDVSQERDALSFAFIDTRTRLWVIETELFSTTVEKNILEKVIRQETKMRLLKAKIARLNTTVERGGLELEKITTNRGADILTYLPLGMSAPSPTSLSPS